MAVYILNLADSTLHGGDDVRTLMNLPCFALVPNLTRRDTRRAPIDDFVVRRPLTAFSEQIRAVHAGLYLGVERPRVVAITAARPAEGKSVLALALARSAALSGEKVLLIDCDMRRPSLARRFGGAGGIGLAELLRGTAGFSDVRRNDPFGDVAGSMHYVLAGQAGGDEFGLFMSTGMAKLMAQVRRDYTMIVLDSPPVQAITEARVLSAIADATILCVRWRVTPRDVVSYALELLEDAHAMVAGIVLTRVDPRAHVRSGYADAEIYHRRHKAYFPG